MAKNKQQIKFEADISGFKTAIKDGESSIKSLTKELKLNKEQLKGNKDNVDLLSTRVETLKQQYEEQTKIVQETNNCYEKAVELFGENSEEAKKWSDKLTDAQTKQQKIKNSLDETNIELKKQSSTLIELGEDWTKSGEKIEKVGTKIEKVGNKLSIVSAGVAAGIGISVKSAIDYESAFAGVEKTVNATEEELQALNEGILDMSTRMPATATEIAGVAESAGQLGIETENILSFTEVMIGLGEATNLSAEEASTSLAKFANIINMSADNYEKLGSTVVALGNNFATTEADIVDMATRLAATGELTGLTEPQIMALATAMSSVGIEAEAGGSAMSKLLKEIQVACETGGDDLKQFAKVAGMSSKDFKKAFEKDAVGALSKFLEGLNDTERNGKSAIAILEDMDLTEVRLSNTILSLSNANGVLSDAVDTANIAWQENTALTDEVDKRYATTESQMEMLKNEVTKLAIEFGNELVPSLRELLQDTKPLLKTVADWIKKFASLDSQTKQNTIKILALTVAIGPFVKTVGSLTSTVGKAYNALGKLTTKLGELKTNTTSASSSITSLNSTIGIAISSVTIAYTTLKSAMNDVIEVYETYNQEVYGKDLEHAKSMQQEVESYKSLAEERQNSLTSSLSEIQHYQNLKNELDTLIDTNGKVKKGYENRANFIANELSTAFGIEIDLTNMTKEKYDELSKAIEQSINEAKLATIMDNLKESYDIATAGIKKAKQDYDDAMDEWYKAASDPNVSKETLEELKKAAKGKKEVYDKMLEDQAKYEYAKQLTAEKGVDALIEISNMANYGLINGAKNSVETISSAMSDIEFQLNNYLSLYKETNSKAYEIQVESNRKQLIELGKHLADTTSTVNEMSAEQITAWKNLADCDLEAYASSLSGLPDETVYKIQEATGRVISDEELANAFIDLGRASIDGFKENNFEQAGKDAATTVKNGVENEKPNVKSAGSSLGGSFIEGFKNRVAQLNTGNLPGFSKYTPKSSNADGLAYVPYNGYVARLHEGERVLTKKENADYTRNNINNSSNSIIVNFYPQQMTEAELDRASRYINRKWGVKA